MLFVKDCIFSYNCRAEEKSKIYVSSFKLNGGRPSQGNSYNPNVSSLVKSSIFFYKQTFRGLDNAVTHCN